MLKRLKVGICCSILGAMFGSFLLGRHLPWDRSSGQQAVSSGSRGSGQQAVSSTGNRPPKASRLPTALPCTFEHGMDYGKGSRESLYARTKEECCEQCRARQTCVGATFSSNRCWFKLPTDLQTPRPTPDSVACILPGAKGKALTAPPSGARANVLAQARAGSMPQRTSSSSSPAPEANSSRPSDPVRSFTRHERVVVVTKVHGHNPSEELLKQSLCFFTAAYNHRAQYDIVVFATELQHFSDGMVRELQAIVHPANLVLVPDAQSLQEEVMALPEKDRALLLKRCNTTVDNITWFSSCSHTQRINYGWQAEFRSKQLWRHPALAKYRYMLWMDADAFAMQEWRQDPVDFLVRNNLAILFDNWPQGRVYGPQGEDRLALAFNTTLCSLAIGSRGRFEVETGNCHTENRARLRLIHGFFHVTDMDFYRSSPVQKFVDIWIGNDKFAREFDDQAAVTAPVVYLAPHRGADMYRSGIKLGMYHNTYIDGKTFVTEWVAQRLNSTNSSISDHDSPQNRRQGFHMQFPRVADLFLRAKATCIPYLKHGS